MNNIVKSNIYRCTEYCPNCPFLDDGKKMNLKKGRVEDIKNKLLNDLNSSFNCHKTVYGLDNNMNNTEEQDLKMCFGAYEFLRKNGKENLQMQLAKRLGIDHKKF